MLIKFANSVKMGGRYLQFISHEQVQEKFKLQVQESYFYSRSRDCDMGTLESDRNVRGVSLLTTRVRNVTLTCKSPKRKYC